MPPSNPCLQPVFKILTERNGQVVVMDVSRGASQQALSQQAMAQNNQNVFSSDATPEDLQSNTPITIRRRIHVNISGTMANFKKQGELAATWKPREGKQAAVFGLYDAFDSSLDHTTAVNALSSARVKTAKILEYSSTFPVSLGVSVSCLNPDEATETGERYVMTALPNTNNTNALVIHEADNSSSESLEWRHKYPEYNENNLETEGVINLEKRPYMFVNKDHPVIEMLRCNKDVLSADIDEQPLVDGQYYKLATQVMKTMCNLLRTKVLSKVSTRDLNTFQVQLHRLNGRDWDSIRKEEFGEMVGRNDPSSVDAITELLNKHCNFTARVELEYEIQP